MSKHTNKNLKASYIYSTGGGAILLSYLRNLFNKKREKKLKDSKRNIIEFLESRKETIKVKIEVNIYLIASTKASSFLECRTKAY